MQEEWIMNDIVSIIIPTFNRAYTLENAISSVLDQSAANWELIIVDDGSTDNTQKVIEKHLSDERIQYFFQENSGVSVARNKGVELSRGDYVIFLDSDDRFLPGLFSKLKEVDYTSYDLICWHVLKKVDGKSSVWKPRKLEKIYNKITATFLAGSICYKKEVFIEAGGFDSEMTFGENYELGLRISQLTNNIKLLRETYLLYDMKKEKRTSDSISNRLYSGILQYRKHRKKYLQYPYSDSNMTYILGFLFEKKYKKKTAFQFYSYAWKVYPLNYKAFLKIIIFKTLNFTK